MKPTGVKQMTNQISSRKRQQRINRLTVLAVLLVLVGGGIYSLFLFNSGRNALSDEEIIALAQQAYEDLDYDRVIELLEQEDNPGSTITAIQGNAELLEIYATARIEFPLNRDAHLHRLIEPLKQISKIEPKNLSAKQQLLDLLFTLNRDSQALDLADKFAQASPDNAEMVRYLATAQLRTNKRAMALETFIRATEIDPLNVHVHANVLDLLQQASDDLTPFIERAEKIYEEFEQDPRAAMIRSLAYRAEDNGVQARAMLKQAASLEPTDKNSITLMAQWLDREGLFRIASDYLIRHAEAGLATRAGELAIYRAFETGNHPAILSRLAETDPRWANPDVLGMWSLAHLQAGEPDAAKDLVKELRRRDTAVADAWTQVLQLEIDNNTRPGVLIDTIVGAFEGNDDTPGIALLLKHPYMLQRLGEAYLVVQEPEAAISALRLAAQNSNSWARPHHALASALLDVGQADDALVYAKQASEREPRQETAALLVRAMIASSDPNDATAVDQALYQADKLLEASPTAQKVFPAMVDLLERAGQSEQAMQRIQAALSTKHQASSEQLLALASLSQLHQLGMESEIADHLHERLGATPEWATLQANRMAMAGNLEDAQKLFESSMPTPATKPWQIALAKFLVAYRAEPAQAYLAELAEQYPEDIELQVTALRHWDDSGEIVSAKQTIQRLRHSAGDSSINWRIAQARLNMLGQPSAETLAQTVELLERAQDLTPIHLRAQLMLTRCLLAQGDYRAALDSAANTKSISPRNPEAMLLYGKTLHQLKRYQDARVDLIAIASNRHVDPDDRLQACIMLEEQGERTIVRNALESLRSDGLANNQALLMLAKEYVSAGDKLNADKLCKELLNDPDAESIGFVASYYRRTNRPGQAEQVLAGAMDAGISTADQLMLSAEDAARRGAANDALRDIELAADQEPGNAQRWHAAAQMALSLSLPDQAQRLATKGLKHLPTDEGLLALIEHGELVQHATESDTLIPLAVTLLTNEAHRPHAIDALRVIQQGGKPTHVAEKLADAAKRAPDFKQLNELAADYLFSAGLTEHAYKLASVTTARFHNSAAAARVATLAAYELNYWPALLSAARTWAERNPQDRQHAHLMRAAAELRLQRYATAVKTLQPYLGKHAAGPSTSETYFELYTHALVMAGKTDEAWATLSPYLQTSPAARRIALKQVSDNITEAQIATRWLEAIGEGRDNAERFSIATASFMAGLRLNSEPFVVTAGDIMERLLAGPGPHGIDAYYVQGQIAHRLDDLQAAEARFRKVLASAPDNPLVLNNLALVLAENDGNNLSEAEQLAERATKLSSKDPNLFDTLAFVRLKLGHFDEALEAIGIAIRLEPENPEWRLTEANILEAKGEIDRAELIRQRYEQRVRF